MIGKCILAWIPMALIGIINGVIRQAVYQQWVGELAAHQISTASGIIFFGLYVWFITGVWWIGSAGQAVAVGAVWLLLTVVFEFVFGHYVAGHPWSRLFFDYNLIRGRLWAFVLLWIAIAPFVFYKLRS